MNPFTNLTHAYGLELRSRGERSVEFETGWRGEWQQFRTDLVAQPDRNQLHRGTLGLVGNGGLRWQLRTSAEWVGLYRAATAQWQGFWFVRAGVEHRWNERLTLRLESDNLLGTDQIANAQLTPFYTETLTREVMGRFLLLTGVFNL